MSGQSRLRPCGVMPVWPWSCGKAAQRRAEGLPPGLTTGQIGAQQRGYKSNTRSLCLSLDRLDVVAVQSGGRPVAVKTNEDGAAVTPNTGNGTDLFGQQRTSCGAQRAHFNAIARPESNSEFGMMHPQRPIEAQHARVRQAATGCGDGRIGPKRRFSYGAPRPSLTLGVGQEAPSQGERRSQLWLGTHHGVLAAILRCVFWYSRSGLGCGQWLDQALIW
jgi:hypothetical protein